MSTSNGKDPIDRKSIFDLEKFVSDPTFIGPSLLSMRFAIERGFAGTLGYNVDQNGEPIDSVGFFVKYILPNMDFGQSFPVDNIDISYLADLKINGSAFVKDRIGYIWVTFAAKIRLVHIFQTILSHPTAFPNVGSLDGLQQLVDPNLDILSVSLDISEINGPLNDHARNSLAMRLSSMTELFLIFHEVSHITNGHLGFVNGISNDVILQENGSNKLIDKITSQTLEWDADCTAVSSMMNFLLGAQPRSVGSRKLARVGDHINGDNLKRILGEFVFAMCIFFRIFHDRHYDQYDFISPENVEDLLKYSHPPAYVRIGSCLRLVSDVLRETFGLEDDFADTLRNSATEAELGWHRAKGNSSRSPFAVEFSEPFIQFIEIYRARWKEIRPYLSQHSFGGKLAE